MVLTFHFGPAGPVGGLRWWGLTKYLGRSGWECHVVSATRLESQLPRGVPLPEGVSHYSLPPSMTLGKRYRQLRRRFAAPPPSSQDGVRARSLTSGGVGPPAPADDSAFAEPPTGWRALRGELAALAAFPDEGRGWLLKAALRARRVIREVRPAAVVSSGPPHSAHLAAWMAVRGVDVRWLMDLRDPWGERDASSPNLSGTLMRSRWLREAMVRCEGRTMDSSDGFITTTPELGEVLARQYPSSTSYCLTNGMDPEGLPRAGGARFPGFSVSHVGTLYARRDPRPLLRAFRRLLDQAPEAREDGSRLRFAGAIEAPYRRMLDQVVAELELEGHVEILGLIPREEALRLLTRSSLAVIMTRRQPLQVPAKLYEPVAMGVPALVLAEEGSATATAARRLGLHCAGPDDVERIAACLCAARSEGALDAQRDVESEIHYETLARDAERILLHDPLTAPRPSPPAWTTR